MKLQVEISCQKCGFKKVIDVHLLTNGAAKTQCVSCKKFSYNKDWRKTILN